MHSNDSTELNVSLEPHLLDALRPLPDLLPTDMADDLRRCISGTPRDIISYSTLIAISQWSRTPSGKESLESRTPPLDASSYSMVALLAGVKTSPERHFGTYTPPPHPEQLAAQQTRERKAIAAIVNALLSILGVGFSGWWAADRLHWKDQWRALLALSVSLVVAMAEGGLFLIWHSRQKTSDSRRKSQPHEAMAPAMHKKRDDYGTNGTQIDTGSEAAAETPTLPGNKLRQRRL